MLRFAEAGSGTGSDGGDYAASVDGGDGAERPSSHRNVPGEPGGEFAADADQRAGADLDDGAAVGGGVRGCDGDTAVDGASAGGFYGADVERLSQIPGIEAE